MALTTYSDVARTFDWSRFDAGGRELWRVARPAGGYASPVYSPGTGLLVGPAGYSEYVAADAETGADAWRVPLGVFIRSTPAETAGGFVTGVSTHLVRFGEGGIQASEEVPGHLFFGITSLLGELAFSLAVRREGDATATTVVAFDPATLRIHWEREIGRDYLISCDTAGIAVDTEAGRLVVNAPDGVVLCMDALDGAVVWESHVAVDGEDATNWRSRPAVADDTVVVGTIEGAVAAFDLATGERRWARELDTFGVWSTPLVEDGLSFVHGGNHLVAVDLATGADRWATQVGFDGYTRPTRVGDHVVVCGGDPPNDGYAVWIDPTAIAPPPVRIEARYRTGAEDDALDLEIEFDTDVEEARIDLRSLGASGDERCVRTGPRRFAWQGPVAATKRLGELVTFGVARHGGRERPFPVRIDTGAAAAPSAVSARTLEDAELPSPQETRLASGPAVLDALSGSFGRPLARADVERAAAYMRAEQGIPPVHTWRGGAGRIFMASRFPLVEESGTAVGPADVERVLARWERDS